MAKIALGRGLGSLIPQKSYFKNEEKNADAASLQKDRFHGFGNIGSFVNNIEIEKIEKNPSQMRKIFDKEALKELAESIKIHGVIEPLLVTESLGGKYQLIAGERRLEAAKIAGLEKVPAIVRAANDQERLELALVENIQRENLNPIEEAHAYKMLASDFNLTQEEIAKRSGKSRSRVANFIRLLSLPIEIQNAISENKISEGHGRAILALANPEKQRALFQEIIKNNLTVRQTEEKTRLVEVASHIRKIGKKNTPWSESREILSDFLDTKVEIKKFGNGARIIIDCAEGEFERITEAILNKKKDR